MKKNVPKGTKNLDCASLLPDMLFDEFVGLFGQKNKGDPDVMAWGDQQLAGFAEWKRRNDLQLMANARINHAIMGNKAGVAAGAKGVLVLDRWEGGSSVSLEFRAHAIHAKLSSILNGLLHEYRPMHLGFSRDRKGMRNVVREVFETATGDQEASAYAQAWLKMAEYVRKRMNDAGAQIPKMKGWGMPQYHDPAKVSSMSAKEWVDSLKDKLDWIRMSEETGLSSADIRELLETQVYQSIVTDGASKIDLGKISGTPQGKGLLNRLKEHRFMHFKDGDSWINYQDEFGTDDYLSAMMDFVQHSSLNIAAMETLGPTPEIGFQHIKNILRKQGEQDRINWLEKVYPNVMGQVGTNNQTLASSMAAIRAGNVVAHLGNATLSMITDPGFLAMTARANDIPIVKTLLRQMKLAIGTAFDQEDGLRFANQIGLVSEYAADRLIAAQRFTDVAPHGFMARLSEITVRASWMHSITVAGRAAFALEYSAAIARDGAKSFDQLSRGRKDAFRRVGITSADWDQIRASGITMKDGVPYADINAIGAKAGRENGVKVAALIQQEMNYAVPTPGAESRTMVNQNLKRGTVYGEFARTIGEFKQFPITMLMLHGRRALNTSSMNKAAYGGGLTALLLALGWVATGAKDISRGRDPISLFDEDGSPNFMQGARVAMQSGALGIYGDLIFADQTRFGASPAATIMGPTVSLGADVLGLMQQSMIALNESLTTGEDKELMKLKKRIGRNIQTYKPEIWQFRALEDRAVNKGINALTDGEWERSLNAADRKRMKEQGQGLFWANDEMLPERAPELSRAQP